MIPKRSDSMHFNDQAIRARVLQAIARNRVPGLHFAGHFLDIEWQEVAGDTARIALPDGPHCRNANGTVNIVALGILADNALAAPARSGAPPGARLGTIHLQLQFTGAPVTGDLSAESRLLGRSEGAALQKSLSSATFYANGKSICHASGEFVLLDAPPGVTLAPLPWERAEPLRIVPVDAGKLEPHGLRRRTRECVAASLVHPAFLGWRAASQCARRKQPRGNRAAYRQPHRPCAGRNIVRPRSDQRMRGGALSNDVVERIGLVH